MTEEYTTVLTCDNTEIDPFDFGLSNDIHIPEQYLYVDDTWGDVMEEFNFNLQDMAVEILRLRERLG